MKWFNIIKGLKCPVCKKNTMETTSYKQGRTGTSKRYYKDRGIMICTNCGHKEVFD